MVPPSFFIYKYNNKLLFRAQVRTQQCKAIVRTKNGQHECKNFCKLGLPYCTVHLGSIMHLKLAPSYLPEHDGPQSKGVFAYRKGRDKHPVFRKGEKICDYTGEVLTPNQMRERYGQQAGPYAVEAKSKAGKKVFIDSAVKRNPASIAADQTRGQQGAPKPNAKFVMIPSKSQLEVIATTDIYPGQEIYLNYGDQYWQSQESVQHKTSVISSRAKRPAVRMPKSKSRSKKGLTPAAPPPPPKSYKKKVAPPLAIDDNDNDDDDTPPMDAFDAATAKLHQFNANILKNKDKYLGKDAFDDFDEDIREAKKLITAAEILQPDTNLSPNDVRYLADRAEIVYLDQQGSVPTSQDVVNFSKYMNKVLDIFDQNPNYLPYFQNSKRWEKDDYVDAVIDIIEHDGSGYNVHDIPDLPKLRGEERKEAPAPPDEEPAPQQAPEPPKTPKRIPKTSTNTSGSKPSFLRAACELLKHAGYDAEPPPKGMQDAISRDVYRGFARIAQDAGVVERSEKFQDYLNRLSKRGKSWQKMKPDQRLEYLRQVAEGKTTVTLTEDHSREIPGAKKKRNSSIGKASTAAKKPIKPVPKSIADFAARISMTPLENATEKINGRLNQEFKEGATNFARQALARVGNAKSEKSFKDNLADLYAVAKRMHTQGGDGPFKLVMNDIKSSHPAGARRWNTFRERFDRWPDAAPLYAYGQAWDAR